MSKHTGIMRAYSGSDDIPEQTVAVDLHRPEAFSGEPITMPLTIRAVQQQMETNLKRWYPDQPASVMIPRAFQKVMEEYTEWTLSGFDTEWQECADIVIAITGLCAVSGIDLQSEIERKLAIVSARTDQAERDRARGIG